jgi:4,5-dihydroxyphthalate decarboxylase
MGKLTLTLACGPYDRTEALRTGAVQPEGIDLKYLSIQSPPEIFVRMIRNQEFDVSEMSSAVYLRRRAKGDFPFVAVPVFPSRMFRHSFVFVNTRSGIKTAKDLEGRRVGVLAFGQTAAVWIRGILKDEYGAAWEKMRWFVGGLEESRPTDELDERPAADFALEFIGEGQTLSGMLECGELDALLGAIQPSCFGRSPHVQRLFPNSRKTELEYYRKTGVFPIMHTLVIRESIYQKDPWIAESLFVAFQKSKELCLQQARYSAALRYTLPWLLADLEEMESLFGPDPWSYGLEPNRKTLETLTRYLEDQALLEKPASIRELFAPISGSH